jgi:tetratricopeptide (TPR) repeat protein
LANNPLGISVSKALITQLHFIQGNISLACEVGEEASRFAEASGDIFSMSWVYIQYGSALGLKGEFDKAERYLLEGLSYCQKTSFAAWEALAARALGNLYFEMKTYGKAQDYYVNAITVQQTAKIYPSAADLMRTDLARARARTGDQDADLHKLFGCFENNKLKFCEGAMAQSIGDILLHMDDDHMADAETWIRKAIEADTKNSIRWYAGTDHALYADWFKRKGDLSNAKEQLTRAIGILKECGADGWVKKYEEELASLS